MKTLLCATDLSDNSVAALKMANNLRKTLNARLYVVHVFDISATFISTVSIAYARMEEAAFRDHHARLLEFCMEHLGRDAQIDKVKLLVQENSIASHGILAEAEEIDPDLILLGTKGSSAVRELFLGSTASALIEKSKYPVLSIPPGFRSREIKTIVYATAFEEADILAIEKIAGLAKLLDADIRLVHVSTKDEYAGEEQLKWFREMLREKVEFEKLSFDLKFSDDVVDELHGYLDEVKPQILIMLEREGHSLISNLWHRDLVKRMKLEVDIPLMSFHKKHLMHSEV
ncbi:MAG: universal stress protein [Flavobacteriaceae bacterium]